LGNSQRDRRPESGACHYHSRIAQGDKKFLARSQSKVGVGPRSAGVGAGQLDFSLFSHRAEPQLRVTQNYLTAISVMRRGANGTVEIRVLMRCSHAAAVMAAVVKQ